MDNGNEVGPIGKKMTRAELSTTLRSPTGRTQSSAAGLVPEDHSSPRNLQTVSLSPLEAVRRPVIPAGLLARTVARLEVLKKRYVDLSQISEEKRMGFHLANGASQGNRLGTPPFANKKHPEGDQEAPGRLLGVLSGGSEVGECWE